MSSVQGGQGVQEMMVNTTIEAAKSRARGPSITEQRAAEEAAEMAKAAAKAAAKKRTGKQSTVRDAVAQTLVACAAAAGGKKKNRFKNGVGLRNRKAKGGGAASSIHRIGHCGHVD